VQRSLGLLWVATAAGANAPDIQTAHALGMLFTGQGGALGLVGALFFAVGSTIRGPIVTWVIFVPVAAFEVPFALWLLIKGVAAGQLKSAVAI
jgi:hypothetical protein